MDLDRREFGALFAAMALMGMRGEAQTPAAGGNPDMGDLATSKVYRLSEIPAKTSSNGGWSRQILRGTLPTGEYVESHQTMLPPGQMPHPPHKHRNTEFVMIREGNVEYINPQGKTEPMGPGDVVFTASDQMHGMKNTGTVPAIYFVVSISRPQTT